MKKIEKGKVLWETVVGSHVWSMEREDSDVDVFKAYIVPTVNVLSGVCRQNSHFTPGDRDESRHEIGVCINQLVKGNINFIIGVTSEIVEMEMKNYRKELRDIVKKDLSKSCYGSFNGLAWNNWNKYIVKNYGDNEKRINSVCRVLNCGIHLMETGKLKYEAYYGTYNEIKPMMKEFKEATDNSNLPNRPDEEPFRNWLRDIRLKELNGEL